MHEVRLDCASIYQVNLCHRPQSVARFCFGDLTMKPTLTDLIDAAIGCAVLFGLLALGLWVL